MLFKSEECFYKAGDVYLRGGYEYQVPYYSENKIIMPSLPWFKFWKELDYKLETKYSKQSFECVLEDELMNQSVLARFGGVNKFVYLTQMTIKIDIHTETEKIDLESLCNLMNYFQSSMMITTLEFEMPFVFSYLSRKTFGDNYQYITSISDSLTNSNKLIDNIINILNESSKTSAEYLYDLSNNQSRRNYQSMKLKKSQGKPEHTLKIFNCESLEMDENDQFKPLT
ncbi:hypothetical protein BN7_4064 [Wickerhamomyces ciferrii]|uniref:Uncharacterized protein n=1 Tax=Wickerhamomyces ciferrii (strain ATCC 14091 / BCRC 22168 / CBS 111 / JCM 3599 / NBRC 0793 / NRRL Y-1031 F-60-10) TaxID=1206466 RepID=K0KH16_WICCF|nr:uncharacterized protein BN7_4064 [Wickerhamomyces ciferrii]CCH44500.1 hypothetical protein BN7_4064 [Wickerhamomyces ciferrii]